MSGLRLAGAPAAPLRPARGGVDWRSPHRIVLLLVLASLAAWAALALRWDWVPAALPVFARGLWTTLWLLGASAGLGILLAVPLGLAQAAGPRSLARVARAFCTVIRGTPLLLQLWLLYYGLGSLFPLVPGLRESFVWPLLREAWPYALLALTLSFAGYEGEVMRGAFAGIPAGQLEAARAFGLSRRALFRRIWLPQALRRALPTLAGETVLQLKATPLVATVTMLDLYAAAGRAQKATFLTYEPLLLLAIVYLALTAVILRLFARLERRGPPPS